MKFGELQSLTVVNCCKFIGMVYSITRKGDSEGEGDGDEEGIVGKLLR